MAMAALKIDWANDKIHTHSMWMSLSSDFSEANDDADSVAIAQNLIYVKFDRFL